MKKTIKINKKKIPRYVFNTLISSMLIFTTLIGNAFSYQEAKTETSENVYSIGEVAAVLTNTEMTSHRDNQLLYPDQFFEVQPSAANVGNTDIYVTLAVKIPSVKVPFQSFLTGTVWADNWDETDVFEPDFYIPAFYSVTENYDYHKGTVNYGIYAASSNSVASKIASADLEDGESHRSWFFSQLFSCYSTNTYWSLTEVDDTYSQQEGGFFVLYYTYRKPLAPNEAAPSPFYGFAVANINEMAISYRLMAGDIYKEDGSTLTAEEILSYTKHYETDVYNENLNITMRLYATQAENNDSFDINANYENDETTISMAEYMTTQLGIFGSETIVSASMDAASKDNSGKLGVIAYITDDIEEVRITNKDTDNIVISLANPPEGVTVSEADENGLIKVETKISDANKNSYYYLEAYKNSELTETVEMGWISNAD